jgi:hypothetical protein
LRWVEVVEVAVEVAVDVVLVVGADVAPVGWVVPRRQGRGAAASAPAAGTGSHTRWDSRATRKSALDAARRWSVSEWGLSHRRKVWLQVG